MDISGEVELLKKQAELRCAIIRVIDFAGVILCSVTGGIFFNVSCSLCVCLIQGHPGRRMFLRLSSQHTTTLKLYCIFLSIQN